MTFSKKATILSLTAIVALWQLVAMAIVKLSHLKPVKLQTLRHLQVRRQLQLLLQVQVVQRLRPLLRQQQPLQVQNWTEPIQLRMKAIN